MLKSLMTFAIVLCASSVATLSAAEPVPPNQTWMLNAEKVIHHHELTTKPDKSWKLLKGEYTTSSDGLLVKELASDMHGAVMRLPVPEKNFIVQYSFKMAGGKGTSFSINDKGGHNSRISISKLGVQIRKDSHDHNKTDKPANLDRSKGGVTENEWHTLQVEVKDNELLAVLDGKVVAFGEHDSINIQKSDIGLTVAGEGVYFRDITIWTGSAKNEWSKQKAELRAQKPADTTPLAPAPAKKPAAAKT